MEANGVHVVRWWLFSDGRASPEFDAEGTPTGFDEFFYRDMDAALAIAEKHNIFIIFSLLNFYIVSNPRIVNGVQVFGRRQVITDGGKRRAFYDNALKPMLRRYGQHRGILAWEIMNEPECAMDVPGGRCSRVERPLDAATMISFINETAEVVKANASQHVTVGALSRKMLQYWRSTKLDFYQFHYYDYNEADAPLDTSFARVGLDKPTVLGEFPINRHAPDRQDFTRRRLTEYLDIMYRNGYAGALAWAYRFDDKTVEFHRVATEFAAWSKVHQTDVAIRLP